MIDTDKYTGHTEGPWCYYHSNCTIETEEAIHLFTNAGDPDDPAYDANSELVADAPLLLQEVKRLREDINQIPIDLLESLDLILEAHHPEVRESVMAMLGDAIGNNVVGYEE